MAYAIVMGVVGGFVMVIFFSFWGRAYGRAHLGRIQGAAQILTVLASAGGPLVLAQCMAYTGSYATALYGLAVVVGVLGLAGDGGARAGARRGLPPSADMNPSGVNRLREARETRGLSQIDLARRPGSPARRSTPSRRIATSPTWPWPCASRRYSSSGSRTSSVPTRRGP